MVAQSSLTNIFAGIVLAATHPFKVGEKISFATWQYPRLPATFPHGMMTPEHRGTVLSIGKIYTRIVSEEGREMLIPNNIMLQSMVLREGESPDHTVRLLVDLPASSNFTALKDTLAELARSDDRFHGPVEVFLYAMTPTILTVEIRSRWKGEVPMEFNAAVFSALQPLALRPIPGTS